MRARPFKPSLCCLQIILAKIKFSIFLESTWDKSLTARKFIAGLNAWHYQTAKLELSAILQEMRRSGM